MGAEFLNGEWWIRESDNSRQRCPQSPAGAPEWARAAAGRVRSPERPLGSDAGCTRRRWLLSHRAATSSGGLASNYPTQIRWRSRASDWRRWSPNWFDRRETVPHPVLLPIFTFHAFAKRYHLVISFIHADFQDQDVRPLDAKGRSQRCRTHYRCSRIKSIEVDGQDIALEEQCEIEKRLRHNDIDWGEYWLPERFLKNYTIRLKTCMMPERWIRQPCVNSMPFACRRSKNSAPDR